MDGKIASARSAKHPVVELYDRLGIQHCTDRDMRAAFPDDSVYELEERHRRRLIRVSTPLVKVSVSRVTVHKTSALNNSNSPPTGNFLLLDTRLEDGVVIGGAKCKTSRAFKVIRPNPLM